MTMPMMPQQQLGPVDPGPPPQAPWTPFAPLPTDDEPQTAAMRQRRLAKLINTAKFASFPPEWQQPALEEYQRMRQVVGAAQMAQQAALHPQPAPKPQPPPQGAPPNVAG